MWCRHLCPPTLLTEGIKLSRLTTVGPEVRGAIFAGEAGVPSSRPAALLPSLGAAPPLALQHRRPVPGPRALTRRRPDLVSCAERLIRCEIRA